MKICITGIAGFVGSQIAAALKDSLEGAQIFGIDNLSRRGAEFNLERLKKLSVKFYHGDLRLPQDVSELPSADWVIDCAANPSVTAGVPGANACTTEQLFSHNLTGTLNILEYCKKHSAGFVLLSTSRVYSINALAALPLKEAATRLEAAPGGKPLKGFSNKGINEEFPTDSPLSFYGATKRCSEIMALEYANGFGLPVWINRCGVIAGGGQFGKIDQGVFSYWVYSSLLGKQLKYIGFGGKGKQVRDCITAGDVAGLIYSQLKNPGRKAPKIVNVGGGLKGSMSLLELTRAVEKCFGKKITVEKSKKSRQFDIPYYVTDSSLAGKYWGWKPASSAQQIVTELCRWACENEEFVRKIYYLNS